MKFKFFLKEDMEAWQKKKREEELAMPAQERLKNIENHLCSRVYKYKHPNNLEDLKFYKKFKPGSFWKKIEYCVSKEHHPVNHDKVMKFLRKNIK